MGIDWAGWARLDDALAAVTNYDAYPLMEDWCQHLIEGNRSGVLKGVDGYGVPFPALKYRDGKGRPTRKRQAGGYGTTLHAPANDALTSAQYRELTGPRLAPRGDQSHVIKNLHQLIEAHPEERRWVAIAAWSPFTTEDGRDIFEFHFDGKGRNPRYDLRPIRDETMGYCLNSLQAFARQVLFANF